MPFYGDDWHGLLYPVVCRALSSVPLDRSSRQLDIFAHPCYVLLVHPSPLFRAQIGRCHRSYLRLTLKPVAHALREQRMEPCYRPSVKGDNRVTLPDSDGIFKMPKARVYDITTAEYPMLTPHFFAPLWLQRFLLQLSQRWIDTIRYKSHALAEFGNGLLATIWAIVPWLPYDTFHTAISYRAMLNLAEVVGLYGEPAEQFIGSLFAILAALHLGAWFNPLTGRRRALAQVMTAIWAGIWVMFLWSNPVGLLPWFHFMFAGWSMWAYLWLRIERRKHDRRGHERTVG